MPREQGMVLHATETLPARPRIPSAVAGSMPATDPQRAASGGDRGTRAASAGAGASAAAWLAVCQRLGAVSV